MIDTYLKINKNPSFKKPSFNCPYCNVFSHQSWAQLGTQNVQFFHKIIGLFVCQCTYCSKYSIWNDGEMIYPFNGIAELPNDDLSQDVKDLYLEANRIVNQSPRSACALLRLALEKLLDEERGPNKNSINKNITDLVNDRKLPEEVKKSMEFIRVVGNGHMHNGVIDMTGLDDLETATKLFSLINLIATVLVSQKKMVNELFNKLPDNEKQNIEKKYTKNT